MASAGSGGCTVGTVCGTDDPSTWPSQDPTRSHRRSYEPWSPTEPRWTKAVGGGDTDAPSPTTQDQIYHCLHYGLGDSKAYDLVLLDEAQDLNPLQHHFLRQCVIPTASRTNLCPDPPPVSGAVRLCGVGDPRQAVCLGRRDRNCSVPKEA